MPHQYQDLISLFNHCFQDSHNTRLIRGEDEPIYLPADAHRPYHAIFFAHGFYSSALHECAHWLIAGDQRRLEVDFGYWYAPDGRDAKQQSLFEQVEVKPQAMEWILAKAAGFPFRMSLDNLNGEPTDSHAFKQAIHNQVIHYCNHGLNPRALKFRQALCDFYQTDTALTSAAFQIDEIK